MNVERLYTLAKAIESDLKKTGIINILNNVNGNLQNIINQPNNPSHQQQLSIYLQQLESHVEKSELDKFPPLWKQSLHELGFSNIVGKELVARVTTLIRENQLTPSVAQIEIQKLAGELNKKSTAISKMLLSFLELQIEPEELKKGSCEVGFLIPRDYVENDLKSLSKEFKEIQDILLTFQELCTGERSSIKVNSIASSDFGLFLDSLPEVAVCVAITVERILALYKTHLEIKKLKQELDDKVPDEHLEGLKIHINNMMKDGIAQIASELVAEYNTKKDLSRNNELTNELVVTLNKLTNRIDRGFNVEVRYALQDSVENDRLTETQTEQKVIFDRILKASENTKFVHNSGEPILFLAEDKKEILQANLSSKIQRPTKKSKLEKTIK